MKVPAPLKGLYVMTAVCLMSAPLSNRLRYRSIWKMAMMQWAPTKPFPFPALSITIHDDQQCTISSPNPGAVDLEL